MEAGQQRPNILLIMSDQHRYDCLGAYGNTEISTPSIDSIARDGVLFRNSFCASPVCTPSRYSVITGLYPHQHLGWNNNSTIPSGLATFPKLLQKNGYRTKAVGKMHYTLTYADVGFDMMELAEQAGDGRYEDDYHQYLRDLGLVDGIDLMDQVKEYRDQAPDLYWDKYGALESDLPEEHHSTTWIGRKALESIDQWTEEANLLMVSFIKPHHPFDPPKPWSRMYDPDELSLLPGWTEQNFAYDLEKHRGYFPHEPLARVPLMVKFPGNPRAGTVSEELVNNIDLAPTLLKQARIKQDPCMKGEDLANEELQREYVFAEHHRGSQYMLRSKTHKLIVCPKPGKSLFFDLINDPFEMNDLYDSPKAEHRESVRRFKEQLLEILMFDHVSPSHLDESAPSLRPLNRIDREYVYHWFKTKMNEAAAISPNT